MRRVGVTTGLGLGLPLHDGHMRQALAGALALAGQLVPIEINERHVFRRHEAFRDQGRSAENEIVSHPDRHVATVAVRITLLPHPTTQIAHAVLQVLDTKRVKKPLDLGRRSRITTGFPAKLVIRHHRLLGHSSRPFPAGYSPLVPRLHGLDGVLRSRSEEDSLRNRFQSSAPADQGLHIASGKYFLHSSSSSGG